MEKVQFQLEATLPELKDLYEKGLFTRHEIDQITKKRTQYETSLIRRTTRKEDFFKYAEYEINLERLRKVRFRRLKYHLNPPPPSASTYSLPRRAIYILKRATAKFTSDIAVWLAYVEYASKEGMRKVVIKGLTSALQHHPLSPELYLLLSYHHLHPESPFPRDLIPATITTSDSAPDEQATAFSLEGTSSARTTLLLGLRMLPQSEVLWTEYIKLELGWVEALRRRWNVLGISDAVEGDSSVQADSLVGGEGSFGPDGEDARKAIISGQLVIHALNSAFQSLKGNTIEGARFRQSLIDMLRVYPSSLRSRCLDIVYDDLGSVAESSGQAAARARLIVMTKNLYDRAYVPGQEEQSGILLEGVELVEELGRIGKTIRQQAKQRGPEWIEVAGEWLVLRVKEMSSNMDLRDYLLSVLTSLTTPRLRPSAKLLVLHLDLFLSISSDPAERIKVARAHAGQYPSHAGLQCSRLKLELESGNVSDISSIAQNTVQDVTVSGLSAEEEVDVRKIWIEWIAHEQRAHENSGAGMAESWERILKLSTKINVAYPLIHTLVLGAYFAMDGKDRHRDPAAALNTVQMIKERYRPQSPFYSLVFSYILAHSASDAKLYPTLAKLCEMWRSACTNDAERMAAVLTWSQWLLENQKAKEANSAIDTLRVELRAKSERLVSALDAQWNELLDRYTSKKGGPQRYLGLEDNLVLIGWSDLVRKTSISSLGNEVESEDVEMSEGSSGEED